MSPTFGPVPPPPHRPDRRHKAQLLAATLSLVGQYAAITERGESSYERGQVRSTFRQSLPQRVGTLIDTEYIIVFRMTPYAMERLRNELYPFLKPNLSDANIRGRSNSNRRPLSVDLKLMMGLMCAGGCTMAGLLLSFSAGKTCIKETVFQFFVAVVRSTVGPIYFPFNAYELKEIADGFLRNRSNHPLMLGCCGALDGFAARIEMPGENECENPLSYINRKGFPALNAQAIADAEQRCRWLAILSPGSTHDSTAYTVTCFARRWGATLIKYPGTERYFYLCNDDAYSCGVNMLCPWPGTGLNTRAPFKDAFNYFLSSGNRNCVERMFGQVYQRWGILWRPLMFPLRRVPVVVTALFRLHNFLKDIGDRSEPSVNSGEGQHREEEPFRSRRVPDGYDHDWHPQDQCNLEEVAHPRVRPGQCPIREHITAELERQLIVRPNYGTNMQV